MKRKQQRKARALRVVKGGAAAAAPVPAVASAPAPPSGPELVGYEENEQRTIAARTAMIDRHRGQRSELQARQARETAELIARHVDEEKALERAQAADVARRWRSEGRELGGWQVRALEAES